MLKTGILTAAILAAAATPAVAQAGAGPAAPVTGRVIMNGDWDGALQPRSAGLPAQWRGLQVRRRGKARCFEVRCAGYAFRLVKTPTRDGRRAARFEVRDGDNPFGDAERAEVQAAPTARAGNLRWYTWSTYLPSNFRHQVTSESRTIQLMKWAVERGAPPIAIYVADSQVTLQVNEQRNRRRVLNSHRPWGTPVEPMLGRWVDFAMFVRWSPKGSGQIQLWVDGTQQAMNWPFGGDGVDPALYGGVGGRVFMGPTLVPGGGPTYVKQGILRPVAIKGRTVVFHDAHRVYAARGVPAPSAPPVTPVTPAVPVLPAS